MTAEARVDFETRCDLRLGPKHKDNLGLGRYAESPYWKALICCYSIDGGPVQTWTYRDGACPADLRAHIEAGGYIRAFNAGFERTCFDNLARTHGWPRPAIDRYRCTAVEAAAMALPRSLGDVGVALGLPADQVKDKRGKELIAFFSNPIRRLKKHANLPPGPIWNEPEDHPEQFQEFVDYCGQDVIAEAAVAERLFRLSDDEQDLYVIDQVVNSRGLRVDRRSLNAALRMAETAKASLAIELRRLTEGAVSGVNSAAEFVQWLDMQGVKKNDGSKLDSIAKDVILDLLEREDLSPTVRRVLEIRQQGAKSSTAKLQAFIDRASPADNRVRHAFVLNAASTGRWSSRGVQLHNLPRPRKIFGDAHLNLDTLFEFIGTGEPGVVELMYGPELGQPLPLLSDALKSFIWADPGKELVVADYSGIEGAVAAWSAREEWKLDAMRAIIADPKQPDLYRLAAEGIYGEPIGKKDVRRQVGKVSELSMQYEGGVGALHSMSRNYNMKLGMTFAPVWAAASEERRERAVKRYERCLKRKEAKADVLTREAWIAGELIKIGWRAKHEAITGGWGVLRDAIREAVESPGTQVKALGCQYLVAHNFLWCRLPSGRCLAYAAPRLRAMCWFKEKITGESECIPSEQAYARERAGEGKVQGPARASVTALGVNSVTLKFERFGLYGGLAFENLVQAIARDLLAHGIKLAERAGYPVIGHVHDEIITEVPRGYGDVKAFEDLICNLPAWATDLPLTSSGYRSQRLKKD